MSIFTNIHKLACRMIPTVPIKYRLFSTKSVDSFGQYAPTYGAWTDARAHVQPGIVSAFGGKNIEEKDYKDLGLDFSHVFITIWISGVNLSTVARKDSPDQIQYDGKTFNVIHVANWLAYDGWKRIYCEEVMS